MRGKRQVDGSTIDTSQIVMFLNAQCQLHVHVQCTCTWSRGQFHRAAKQKILLSKYFC